jgi:hypothetical protein
MEQKWNLTRQQYKFFYVKGNENHELGAGSAVHKRIISAVRGVLSLLVTGCRT